MNRKQKKELRQRQSTQQLMGIDRLTDHGVKTPRGELVYFLIRPDNLSVLSAEVIRSRIRALMELLGGIDTARLLALDSRESFQQNKLRYPFQIAAASFALRSPWQKGVILCDEAGLGKSHEALLILAQRYLEGATHLLLCIPNLDLLAQWLELLDRHYTLPYTVLCDRKDFDVSDGNAFDHDGIVITTYDFAATQEAKAAAIEWDVVAFEEANALSGVYRGDSKVSRSLHRIAGDAFKLLSM